MIKLAIPVLMVVLPLAWGESCRPVQGERIRGRDLAAADPELAALPADLDAGLAPVAGARRQFTPSELTRIAQRHGVAYVPKGAVCFERAMRDLDQSMALAAMQRALGSTNTKIEIVEMSHHPVPDGDLWFPLRGLSLPPPASLEKAVRWGGYVRQPGNRRFRVWARVVIQATATRVVATEDLRVSEPIRAGQIRVETVGAFPLGTPWVASPEEVVGQVPRRSIDRGRPIPRALLSRPRVVAKGDVVRVDVQTGGARLSLEGRAESSGRQGDMVLVRNESSGRRFRARVEGPGRASVAYSGRTEAERR